MEKISSEGKTFEEAIDQLKEKGYVEEEYVFTKEESTSGLFKHKNITLNAYKKEDIYDAIKSFLKDVIENLGLEVSFEVKTKEGRTTIQIYTDNNSLIIGRGGNTIKALETLVKQYVYNLIGVNFIVSLDVENYKGKKQKRIIRMAKDLAREVSRTKIRVEMDSMNSFERRIVHSALSNYRGVSTKSEGEEPNRYVVIMPEDKD